VLATLTTLGPYAVGSAVALWASYHKVRTRVELSRAKYRSLAGHARISRIVAGLMPFYEYDETRFFRCDSPTDAVAERRRSGFTRLSTHYREHFRKTAAMTADVTNGISDLQFTGAYRVPFQFSRVVQRHLSDGSFLAASSGVTVTDLDGNTFYDLTGCYGVNVFGHDFYKGCIAAGAVRVQELGAVLGAYHSVVAYNVARLRDISGLDEVSFHMSGTEAVMQAVRLARYHTRRRRLVRFCGAYHGWWGGVQPGVGNPSAEPDTLTLADISERTLRVLRRRRDIACVLVNPLQALHPNRGAPSDASLIDSTRTAHFDREAYTSFLQQLRTVCDERNIVLIFDEVFVGFRLASEGARSYFGVQPDLITYGKTLGGGLPVGVLCGRSRLMKRYRDDRPADICFARGTFNSHPYVMGAMHEFLRRLETPAIQALYTNLDALWNGRAEQLNRRLAAGGVPVSVANLSSIWTFCYTRPSRYNWMLQYYIRAEGLALSWVGTGRLIFSFDYTDADYAVVVDRILAACGAMHRDGWWDGGATTNKAIKRNILREAANATVARLRRRSIPASSSAGTH